MLNTSWCFNFTIGTHSPPGCLTNRVVVHVRDSDWVHGREREDDGNDQNPDQCECVNEAGGGGARVERPGQEYTVAAQEPVGGRTARQETKKVKVP